MLAKKKHVPINDKSWKNPGCSPSPFKKKVATAKQAEGESKKESIQDSRIYIKCHKHPACAGEGSILTIIKTLVKI